MAGIWRISVQGGTFMEGITIYNDTMFKIHFYIFKAKTAIPIESGLLEPRFQNERLKGWTGANYNPGKYRIEGLIENPENGIALNTFVNIDIPIEPIEIKTDDNGRLWWKIFKNKG